MNRCSKGNVVKLPHTEYDMRKIASYQPNSIDAETWAAIVPLVRRVASKTPTNEPITRLLWMNAKFAAWAFVCGLDVTDAEAVYTRNNLERFLAEACGDLSASSRATMRSILTRSGMAITTRAAWPHRREAFPRTKLKVPYRIGEIRLMDLCAASQTSPLARRAAETFFCLGLGVGANPREMFDISGARVVEQSRLLCVQIGGARPRLVPVRLPYAERLAALAETHRDEPMLGPWTDSRNRVGTAASRIQRGRTTPAFSAARFRSTWLLDLLADPAVPISAILDASGLKTFQTLSDLIPHLPRLEQGDALARLAGKANG